MLIYDYGNLKLYELYEPVCTDLKCGPRSCNYQKETARMNVQVFLLVLCFYRILLIICRDSNTSPKIRKHLGNEIHGIQVFFNYRAPEPSIY